MKPPKRVLAKQVLAKRTLIRVLTFSMWLAVVTAASSSVAQEPFIIREHYTKQEQLIPMRDGVKLFTSIYIPKDTSQKYPIMLDRTPYSVAPYGAALYKVTLGPSSLFAKEGYIFVYQDVRGRMMSEGQYADVRPHNPNKKGTEIDENSDTYDTIEWLLKNIPNHNGRVGIWGISYPGFYTSTAIIDSHPAIKAASPQAPIGDWFIGDDFHHNGTLFLPHAFNFYSTFGLPRPRPTTQVPPPSFKHGMPDGYKFFLEMGPLSNANKMYYKNEVAFWNEMMKHPNYDEFWKARNILPHLKNVKSAVMTVGGWYDAEDLYGALNTYQHIEKQNPGIVNILVMGPWQHGGWAGGNGESLGNAQFGSKTSVFYRENIELPFFNYYLKDKGEMKLPEAYVFETGSNVWKTYDQWPPKNMKAETLYLHSDGRLSFEPPKDTAASFDEYVSDPNKPVPHIDWTAIGMTTGYMVADQRHAARRTDVLVYKTEVLTEDVTIAGPITASLFVSTTGTDSDFIVKLIDVYPDDAPDNSPNPAGIKMGGFQMLVRGEPMRAKFRKSFERPEPMIPGKVDKVEWVMPDSYHTFKKGHRIMVQVQSSWFPLVDRNPQKFVDIYNATEADFQKATQRVYHSKQYGSQVKVGIMK